MFTNEDLQLIRKLLINHINDVSKRTPTESIECSKILKKIDLFLSVD